MLSFMASTKASGRNISDAERNTIKVTLRLGPEHAETLADLAEGLRCPKSYVVAAALEILDRLLDGQEVLSEEVPEILTELYARDDDGTEEPDLSAIP